MSETSNNTYAYISDTPAGSLLNDSDFINKLSLVTGDSDLTSAIVNASNNTKYSVGTNLCLNDLISKSFMETASGDIRPLVFEFDTNKVFYRTEVYALIHILKSAVLVEIQEPLISRFAAIEFYLLRYYNIKQQIYS